LKSDSISVKNKNYLSVVKFLVIGCVENNLILCLAFPEFNLEIFGEKKVSNYLLECFEVETKYQGGYLFAFEDNEVELCS